jgi:peptide/nickel transport system substrate-binding protein
LLTTDDIEYTIQKIQDGDLKSPRRVDWASIVIKKISATEIQFILKQPYTPFLSNTTIGILPKHIWKNINTDQFIFNQKNLEPIGSGPYEVNTINKDKDGNPTSYTLTSFNKFYNGEPYISKIYINFYQNEDEVISGYKDGSIENFAGISAQNISKIASTTSNSVIIHNPLPRIFGIFLNQNNSPVLANKEVRQALNMSVNKDKIVKDILYNYGVSINSPIPVDSSDIAPKDAFVQNSAEAKSLLAKNGWLINSDGILQKKTGSTNQTLEFTITTADSADLKKVAELVKKDWENLGAKVNIKVFEFGDLSQNIIKTRKYDALLFGEIISKDLDLYAFWHSSQRNAPGLNVSMYVNSKVDKILEDVRSTSDQKQRDSMRESFKKILKDEVPAVFLYSPEYIYVMSKEIDGYNLKSITNHSDRFYGIEKWFINTDNIWKIFVKNNN